MAEGAADSGSGSSLGGVVVNVINTGCVSNCSGNGACIDNHCACYTPYCMSDCSKTFPDALGAWYYVYTIGFGVAFIVIAFWAMYKAYNMLRVPGRRAAFKVLPIIYYMIVLDGFVNGFELLVDDQGWKGILGRTGAFLLYGIGVWLLLAIFIMMILLWVECYHKMTKKTNCLVKVLRPLTIGLLIVTFAIEVTFRVMWTPTREAPMIAIYYSYLLIFTTSLAVGFLIYGIKLYKRVRQINTPYSKTKEERLKKIHRLSIGSAIIVISGMIIVILTGLMEELVFGTYDPAYFIVQQSLFHLFQITFLAHVTSTLFSPHSQKDLESLRNKSEGKEAARLLSDQAPVYNIQLS